MTATLAGQRAEAVDRIVHDYHLADRRTEWSRDGDEPALVDEACVTGLPNPLANLRNGAWLDQQRFPALRYVVSEIIPEGTTVLAGPPKVGKSWLVLGVALAVASGGTTLGALPVGHARPVLYLALEDGYRRLQSRCRALLAADEPIPHGLDMMIQVEYGAAAATVGAWLERHGEKSPLVIVDTLGRVMPAAHAGEPLYQRDTRALAAYQALGSAHPGAAILLVHHTRKQDSSDYVDSVSGTLGITGVADTTVVLSRTRADNGGLLRVTGRDVAEADYAVEIHPDGSWALTGGSLVAARKAATEASATAGLGDRSTEIYQLVAKSEGIGPTAVADKLGIGVPAAGQYLARLVTAGRITKTARGVYRVPSPTLTTEPTQ